MSGLQVIRDYVRDAVGVGINGATYVIKRLVDDVTIASGSTASDSDPNTALAGMFDDDETTIGYPGPIKYTVTDATSGAVRVHTSKSLGLLGPIRAVDITRFWRIAGDGVSPGLGSELAVSASGASMDVSIASGQYIGVMGDHALVYSYPSTQTLTVATADATNPRIDTVVLRFYPPGVEQEGRVILALLAGTPAGSPAAPSLTQNTATVWEVALANIQVDAGVTTIASNKVTDRRGYSLLYPSGITAGDTFYVNASGKLSRLAKGTANMVLQQGATVPAWASTLAGLTLTAPTIGDFTNAGHDHLDADDGGTLTSAAISDLAEFIRDTIGTALVAGSNVTLTVNDGADTITIAATSTGDASTNTSSSVDSEVVLFSGTGGKTLKRAAISGLAKLVSGVLSAATAGTDYYAPGSTDVAVADGGTGSSNASDARTALGAAATSHTHAVLPITREVNDQRDIVASGSATISSTTGATVGLSDTMVLAADITYDIFVWGCAMLNAGAGGSVSVALDISGTGVTWTPVYIGSVTESGERTVMPTARVTGVVGEGQTITVTMLGKRVTSNGSIGSASFQGLARPRST